MKAPKPEQFKQVKDYSRPVITFGIARVPGTDRVFLASSDFSVSEADLSAGKFEAKELYKHGSYATTVALAGRILISGGYDGKLVFWDTEAKTRIRLLDAHTKWIRQVDVSPDGKTVASVADDMSCKLWDVASGKLIHDLRGHQEKTPHNFISMLYAVAFNHDGSLLATGDKTGHIVIWDPKTGKQRATCATPVMYTWDKVARLHSIGGIRSLAFSPDSKQLAVGGMGKVGNIDHLEGKARIEILTWETGKQVVEFQSEKFKGLVNRLSWASDSTWLLGMGGAGEGFAEFIDPVSQKSLKAEKLPMHIHDIDVQGNHEKILAAGHNKIVAYTMS